VQAEVVDSKYWNLAAAEKGRAVEKAEASYLKSVLDAQPSTDRQALTFTPTTAYIDRLPGFSKPCGDRGRRFDNHFGRIRDPRGEGQFPVVMHEDRLGTLQNVPTSTIEREIYESQRIRSERIFDRTGRPYVGLTTKVNNF
jgi:hypothetical protein